MRSTLADAVIQLVGGWDGFSVLLQRPRRQIICFDLSRGARSSLGGVIGSCLVGGAGADTPPWRPRVGVMFIISNMK